MSRKIRFISDTLLKVGDSRFHCACPPPKVGGRRLKVHKNRDLVERYIALRKQLDINVIVEIGVFDGGSTALLSALYEPTKLLAFEISEKPARALTHYIEVNGLEDVVLPFYGVNQADRTRLLALTRDALGASLAIDLVFDDASHALDETRASFEALFPMLRPDGLFIIEDWQAQHKYASSLIEKSRNLTSAQQEEYLSAIRSTMLKKLQSGNVQQRQQMNQRIHRALERQSEVRGAAPAVDDISTLANKAENFERTRPLTELVVQLVLANISSADAVRDIQINPDWVIVRRGSASLDPETFSLDDLYEDHFGFTHAFRN